MKKILFSILAIFIITGCSNNVVYEFKDNEIYSTVEIEFNEAEFEDNYNKYSGEGDIFVNSDSTIKMIESFYNSFSVVAFQDYSSKMVYYTPVSLIQEDNKFIYNYDFKFNYDNFKENYYFKECFEYFTSYEDGEYYYYKLSGNLTCANMKNFKIKVKSNNRMINSNSDNIKDGVHIWNVENDGNDIFFAVSKEVGKINDNKNVVSTISIIGFVILVIFTVLSIVIYKKSKSFSNY